MIYQHKKTKALVETICSGTGWICFVELGEDKEYDNSSGKVFRGGKSEFKKFYKKASQKAIERSKSFQLPEELKRQVELQIEHDIFFILNDFDAYIERKSKRSNNE